ncbi:MAG TPA: TPM domain-containing protein [Cyclobacteriaceae bacterium]|jgi:uncharacterized protein|nr:TPM domain-containing protein [Cyclobacteriaceae bacterium]
MAKIELILPSLVMLVALLGCESKSRTEEGRAQYIRVYDKSEILSDSEERQLNSLIQQLETDVGSQLAVIIIDSLDGKDINQYSLKKAREMNLGRAKFNDGILLTFVYKEHNIRIEVGAGLEKIIKDEVVGRIIRDLMVPKFKEQKFFDGIANAVRELSRLIEENKGLIGQTP